MSTRLHWHHYLLVLLLGFLSGVVPTPLLRSDGAMLLAAMLALGLINAVAGFGLGYLYSDKSWRWGLWLAAPLVFLTMLSLSFVGKLQMFLTRDVPVLIIVVAFACVGAYLGGRLHLRKVAL